MAELLMPRLSDAMQEGTVLKWLITDGETVAPGAELVEVETDKATIVVESESAGVIRLTASEGDAIPVGAVLARIEDDDSATTTDAGPSRSDGAATINAPSSEAHPRAAPPVADPDRIKASPIAKRIADRLGVELASLSGSGPGGRIVKADVEASAERGMPPTRDGSEAAMASSPSNPMPDPPDRGEAGPQEPEKGVPQILQLNRTQELIARRMTESKASVPEFALQTRVDMSAAMRLRAELKEATSGEAVPSLNDFLIRACALSLPHHPKANGRYADGVFELYPRINVGFAVATPDSLVVPTIFDADTKSLRQIGRESRALIAQAKDAALNPRDLSGGTFTISNLGMFGVTSFTAIINAPQAAILAVGAVHATPVIRDGGLDSAQMLDLTLTCDHRILYGADAAGLLAEIKGLLERPLALVL